MTTTQLPPPPAAVRWTVLVMVSITMFGMYYAYDSIAPLADILQRDLGFTATQVGALNAVYSLPNVFLVLVGGMLVDRFGVRNATLGFTIVSLLGTVLTAASGTFPMMVAGRLLFGLGAESMNVAITAALGQWFKGRQLGFAFGLNLSLARAGSYAADLSPSWAAAAYATGWRQPLLISLVFAAVSAIAALAYWIVERGAASRFAIGLPPKSDHFAWSDLWRFDKSYWYLVGLCVTFYSVVFPFRSTFAIEYFQNAHGLPLDEAGQMNGYVFLAAIFATPLFGLMVDKLGRRSIAMFIGSLLLLATFPTLLFTSWDLWVTTVMLGIAFSLVPAVLWPSVPYLVEENRLGTAYGLMTMLQNIGLAGFNLGAGALNDLGNAGIDNPRGYDLMLWMFTIVSAAALVFSWLLRQREKGPHGHGLETVKA